MPSVILATMARPFWVIMLAASVYILLRGHNEPGGGFVGGLMAAAAFAMLAFANGVDAARRALYFHPVVLVGAGVLAAIVSGIPGLFTTGSFLTHLWPEVAGIKLGTTILFDIGVYLVVLGGVLCLILRLYEDDDE
ncbi:Na(+)/H(+) antiporter subunit B [Aliihoeflea aestuarii]|jgi:multicomponent Na+:H+ antiporter subunit B|uniref:MnhB domain-containing protein n=1 Tax=Aliihoeflea aestuarii TaxID=453840 RepID=UPI00209281B2|nr:MnhB domain-containing protein [Aliihoeflea aestuarii]MCO6390159.1 Na(+)/H(+) antiporter subunit B [Aliihoeflea aestuarii]